MFILTSITKNTPHQTLKFAKQHTNIDKNHLRIINYCRKSLLFSDKKKNMEKKSTGSCFDITMGSFEGAGICGLVGLYIQSKVEKILPKSNFGLYRDDGLTLLRNQTGNNLTMLGKTSEYLIYSF